MKPGDLVYDVGANEGRISEIYQELGATVVAIEPNPTLAKRICRRYRPNAVMECAIASRPGRTQLQLGVDHVHSTINPQWMSAVDESEMPTGRWAGSVEVEVQTLDNIIRTHGAPDVIKIDIEGSEHEALEGLSYAPRFLYFEYQNAFLESSTKACKLVEKLGDYRFNFSAEQNHH